MHDHSHHLARALAESLELAQGRYRTIEIVGEGAMGRTYLAQDHERDELVAIKALYPSRLANVKDLELFMREADILGRLDHPQIPAYVDSFHEGDDEAICYYLVQSYIAGETLREQLEAGKRFDIEACIELGRSLVEVLVYMHALDPPVIHRDIKPDNIIIDARGRPALVDFGAVREIVRLTMRGGSTIIGTYGYMPPEQLMGRALEATDLYAVGITLLECLCRRTPGDLTGNEAAQMIEALHAPEDFKRILSRLCAPGLRERYAHAHEVLTDLERFDKGRALVHADALEGAIEQRAAEKAKLLRKHSSPGIHWGYVLGFSVVLVATTAMIVFMLQAFAVASISSGATIAGALSALGMVMSLLQLGSRYTYDAWSPPAANWVRTRGEIVEVTRGFYDEYNRSGAVWRVHYSFPTRTGFYRDHVNIDIHANPSRFHIGRRFDVFYPPGKPQYHEIEDFTFQDIHALGFELFDHREEHHAE